MTDPIADMLTRIRNALAAKKSEVIMPYSKIKFDIVTILEKEKWIKKVEVISQKPLSAKSKTKFKHLKITLRYNDNNQPSITSLKRVSTPGRRVYVKKDKTPIVLSGFGLAILSTSKGIMVGKEAYKKGIGGELICEIS
ncbi:30S ribosomal protein S8 [Patescibacteria group bacterium AH-259-L05]|nr:30S ribosomal protein S8 [Patescibacteria group bacterium AH-259-L05]